MNIEDYVKMMEKTPAVRGMNVPVTSGNPYLKMMEDNEAENQVRFAASVMSASSINPDEEARKKRIADLLGVNSAVVDANPDLSKQMADRKKVEVDTQDTPGLRKKYADIDFAKLASDQSAHLGLVERTLRDFVAGYGGDLAGSGIRGLGHTLNSLERLLIGGERHDPYTGETYDLYKAFKGDFPAIGKGLVDVGQEAKDYWQRIAPKDQNFYDQVVRGVGQITGQLALMVASPASGVALMYGQGADQMMEKIEKDKIAQKADQTSQDLEVLSGGVITAVTEWASSKLLLNPPQLLALKSRLLNYVAKVSLGGAEEGVQETLENIGQDLSHITFTNPESKVAWNEAIQSGEVGGIVGAIASSVINGALHVRARGVQKSFSDLSDATKVQKLRERDPSTYQGFADTITSHLAGSVDNAVENIYIDANAFYQSVTEAGIDPYEVAKVVPSIAEQLDEAKVTGGDIVIPLNEFVGKIAGTELNDILAQHLRSTPESPSIAEMEAAGQISGEIQKKADTILKTQEKDKEVLKSANEVHKIIFDQLNATGVYKAPVARAYASMVRDFYVTQAAEQNILPMDVYNEHPYRIIRGEVGPQEVTQKQINTETPEFKSWFGESKVVDKAGKPLAVYHGAIKDIQNVFDPGMAGKSGRDLKKGIYFTNTKWRAEMYAEEIVNNKTATGTVPACYLDIKNPLVFNHLRPDASDDTLKYKQDVAWVASGNSPYDGVIINGLAGETDYIVFSPTQIKSVYNRGTFDPNDPNILNQSAVDKSIEIVREKRGGFNPERLTAILTEKADYSTFVHETAHFFLSTYADLAMKPNASPRIKNDMQTVLKWFGVSNLQEWNALSLEDQRKHHEAFAYNFEIYLFEGKAPNIKMQGVFERFAAWLKKVYTSIRDEINEIYKSENGVDLPILTGEVKQVMDRMLASDKQIQQAERIRGMLPIFVEQSDTAMNDEEWKAYQEMHKEAHDIALEDHQTLSLRQMKWVSGAKSRVLRAMQEEANEIRKWVASEVTQEVNALPIYKAKELMKTAADDIELSALADALGFTSVGELKTAIANAPKKKDVIKENTDARMLEEYGDFSDPKAMANAVDRAIHNEARARFIGVELRYLAKTGKLVRVMQEAAKQAAQSILGKQSIHSIKPREYAAAEARAADSAEKAMRKGDAALAAQYKEHQLLQNQLASEALKANAFIAKTLESFKRVFTSDSRLSKTRDMNYVNTARAILAKYGFGTSEEPAAFYLAKIKAYDPDFFAEVEPMITAHQLQTPAITSTDPKNRKPLDKMTLADFHDLTDQIEALWHLSRRNKQIEIDGKLIVQKAVVEELNDQIRSLNSPIHKPGYTKAVSTWEEAKIKLMGMRASMRRVEAWVSAMDKGVDSGVFRKYVWNPISESVAHYRTVKVGYMEKYVELLKSVEPLLKGPNIYSPEIKYAFKPQELLHALLHTGNLSNKRKLLLGRNWASLAEDGQTMNSTGWDNFILRLQREGTLTKDHYDFIQKVWDLVEQTKPAAQKAHKEMYGFYFNEITATPFNTPFGTYAGGYVPAVTDPSIVTEGAMRNEQETQSVDNSYMFPTTGRGFTKSRVEYNKPLLLNLGYLASHIDKVLRFTYIEPRIKDVGRIVKTNKAFASVMDEFDPTVRGDMLLPWLQRTAVQIVSMPSKGWGGKAADSIFRYLRVNTGFQMMVGNITNTLQQFTGVSISALKVKPRFLRNALWQYVRQPKDTAALVSERSEYMRTRINNDQYEIIQTIDELLLNPSKYEKLQNFTKKHGYFMQQATQGTVDVVTWVGAYNQALENGTTEKEAVRQADAAVRMTQGSFAPEDVSRIETGSAFMRAFIHFYSYFNMQANILGTEFLNVARTLGVRKGAGKLLYIYAAGFMVPTVLSEMIVQAAGGFDAGDDDEYDLWDAMRLFFSAQARPIAAMVPGVGPAAIATVNAWNDKHYDDRLSTSPAVSTIESAVRAPYSVYKALADDGSWKRGSKDLLTLLGLLTNVPLGQIGKPVGYIIDVEQGRATPESTGDYMRGLLSGKDVNKKQ